MYDPIERVIDAVREGRIVMVADDATREGEVDFVVSAYHIDDQKVNDMVSLGKGLLCAAMSLEKAQQARFLRAGFSVGDDFSTAWTGSFDYKKGLKTGISCQERAMTIKALAHDAIHSDDFVIPGHVMGLVARPGGVLERPGHTEACVDLMNCAELPPVGGICEILDASGDRAKGDTITSLKEQYGFLACRVEDIVHYRRTHEKLLERTKTVTLPTPYGMFLVRAYKERIFPFQEHLVLVKGIENMAEKPPLVRVHSECLTGDVFGSSRCDCGSQLSKAMKLISSVGCGIIVYLRQEGRGIGLANKVKAYKLQDEGLDTVEANVALGFEPDERDYWAAAQMLKDLQVPSVRLLTNNMRKVNGLRSYGINVGEHCPLETTPTEINKEYLSVKKKKLGHMLGLV